MSNNSSKYTAPNITRRNTLGLLGLSSLSFLTPVSSALEEINTTTEPQGTQEKIVFFDDVRIVERDGVDRVVHEAYKYDQPVMEPTKPWEQTFGSPELPGNVYVFGTVMYDEDEEVYEMWYTTFTLVEPDFSDYFYSICYAYSEDGIDWQRPNLGLIEYEGTTDNNIVYRGTRGHPLSVIREGPTPTNYVASGDSVNLFTSPDGLDWTLSDARLPSVDGGPDAPFAAYDPSKDNFMSYYRGLDTIRGNRRRIQYHSRSDNFEDWSDPEVVIEPDERDDELAAEFGNEYAGAYHMPVLEYDGIYVGLLSLITVGASSSEQVLLQLAFSRDRESWLRPDRRSKIPLGEDGEFDSDQIYCAGSGDSGSRPLVVDDEIRVYYGGWDGPHDSNERGAAIGLATWRLDGFASLSNVGESTGIITTEVVTFEDDYLHVNVDLENEGRKNGLLAVEVLDDDGDVIPGFEREKCTPIKGDEIDRKVNWRGPAKLDALTGEDIQFRLYLNDGNLYSLQFDHKRIAYDLEVTVQKADGTPIEDVVVATGQQLDTTDEDGVATLALFNGTYTVDISGEGLPEASREVTIQGADESLTVTTYPLEVTVETEENDRIEEAEVTVDGLADTTDKDGTVTFDLFNGEYSVTAVAEDFDEASTEVTISDSGENLTMALAPLDIEPVAHYALDEIQDDGTVLDTSPNEIHGTNNGATVVDGVVGNALDFGGEGVSVDLPDDPSLSVENVTVAAWVSPEPSVRSYIFDGRGHEYLLNEREETEQPQLMLWVDGDFYRCIAPADAVPDSEWYHVAATYDGATMRLYINGELVQTNDDPAGPIDVSSGSARIGNFIGAEEDSRDWSYQGVIDDIYIYNRSLSEPELQVLYNRKMA